VKEKCEESKSEIVRFYMITAGICARQTRLCANFGIRKTGRFYNPCTRSLFQGSIAHDEEKGGRQAGEERGGMKVERKEVETKKKREERPISSVVEFHERAIAADVRSAGELCGREIPRE